MTSPTGRTRSRKVHAFTLLELILVLAILALAAGVAAPSLSRFSRGRQTLDAAAHMLAVIQYAQDQAVVHAAPHRFQLDTAGGTYWLTARRDGAFARLGNDFGQTFTLPASVTAAWDAGPEVTARSYIQFEPDGGHDVASVRLTASSGGDGSVTSIGCASPAEPFRVSGGSGDIER
jgi:prepilin-type N-terminal cleavage/methylation domain-containing protein